MSQLLVSVIIPCYNDGVFLQEAIQQLNSFTIDRSLYEVIIVNDGSKDEFTLSYLQTLSPAYTVIHQANGGLGNARNSGIEKAAGKYILLHDADNLITEQLILKAIQVLDNDEAVSIVYSDAMIFGLLEKYRAVGKPDLFRLLKDNYIDACAVFRKQLFNELGGFDGNMPFMGHEDWDFWLRMLLHKKNFHYIPEPLYKYRVRDNSMLKTITGPGYIQNRKYIYSKYSTFIIELLPELIDTRANFQSRLLAAQKNETSFGYLVKKMFRSVLPQKSSSKGSAIS